MGSNDCLGKAAKELKEMTPPPMNTMLDKETRESALDTREKRKKMTVKNVPPTTPCEYVKLCNQLCMLVQCDNPNWYTGFLVTF